MDIPEKVNLSHIVGERIKSYILEHDMVAGDRLPTEKQLIEALGVSRTVVREALKLLELLGIIRIRAGDGIYVDSVSLKPLMEHVSFRWKQNKQKMKELLATRRILELGAVEMAVQRYDLEAISEMEGWTEAMADAIRQGKPPYEEDLQFHRVLFQATGNVTYYELSEVLTDFFATVRELHFGRPEDSLISLVEHRNIVLGIRERNMEMAKREMELHLLPLHRFLDEEAEAEAGPCKE